MDKDCLVDIQKLRVLAKVSFIKGQPMVLSLLACRQYGHKDSISFNVGSPWVILNAVSAFAVFVLTKTDQKINAYNAWTVDLHLSAKCFRALPFFLSI